MPKIKSRRAAKKRFRITKKGKVMRGHSKMRHLLESKRSGKKRSLRKRGLVAPSDVARVRAMLPGG